MSQLLRQIGCTLGALLVASGCATAGSAGQGFDGRPKQADERLPAASRFYVSAERKLVEEAQAHQAAARKAIEEGNAETARVEAAAAAERYARFADTYPASEWRLTFRYEAAQFLLFAQQHEKAAGLAEQVMADPAANEVTRAMAAHLAALGWRAVAKQRIAAGALEAPSLRTVEARAGAPVAPRPLPEPWRRYVAAADTYVALWKSHPEVAKRAPDRNLALSPWSAALVAAEVEYSCDQMGEAIKRLQQIVETWPGEADVMEGAVPDLLQAHLVLGDDRAFDEALGRLSEVVQEQAGKATEAKAKETFAKLRDELAVLGQWHAFAVAKRALDAGKLPEAAEAFERFAEAYPAAKDAPSALFNAAAAWDKAEKPEKAVAAREAILAKYGDAKVAPVVVLQLANGASKRNDHAGAARHYDAYIARWPDAPNRCIAMQNAGYEYDVDGKKAEAADRYLAFGKEERCRKERPNDVAKALYLSGKIFSDAKQKPRAREAFEAAASVEGATEPTAKSMIDDAKKRAKRL